MMLLFNLFPVPTAAIAFHNQVSQPQPRSTPLGCGMEEQTPQARAHGSGGRRVLPWIGNDGGSCAICAMNDAGGPPVPVLIPLMHCAMEDAAAAPLPVIADM